MIMTNGIITTSYKDTLIQSKFEKLDEESLEYFFSPFNKNLSINICITRYALLLQSIFGGFNIIKRNYYDSHEYILVIYPNNFPLKSYLEEKINDVMMEYHEEIYRGKSFPCQLGLGLINRRNYCDSQEFILNSLSLWYNGKKGLIFEMFDTINKRCDYDLPTSILLNIDLLSENIRNNIKINFKNSKFCYHLNQCGEKETYLYLNVIEFYFILLINYADVKLNIENYDKITVHQILMQNYFCTFIPIKNRVDISQKLPLSIPYIPMITLPEIFIYANEVNNKLKIIPNYTSEMEYFVKIISGCLKSYLNSKNKISFEAYKPYNVPNIRIINYIYIFSHRLLLSSRNLLGGEKNTITYEVLMEFLKFIKYFILQSCISFKDFVSFNSIVDLWILWTNPFKYCNNISSIDQVEYTKKITSLYIYGYRIILDNVSKVKKLKERMLIYYKIFNNYEIRIFKIAQTEAIESTTFTAVNDIPDLYGYEALEFEHSFNDVFHRIGLLYHQFHNSNTVDLIQARNSKDFVDVSNKVAVILEKILREWNGGCHTNNMSYLDYYREKLYNSKFFNNEYSLITKDNKSNTLKLINKDQSSTGTLRYIYGGIDKFLNNLICNNFIYPHLNDDSYLCRYFRWKMNYYVFIDESNPPRIVATWENFTNFYYIAYLIGTLSICFKFSSSGIWIILISVIIISLSLINFSVDKETILQI